MSLQGDEQNESQQLALLAEEAGGRVIGSTALSFGTWDAALTFLGEQAAREPLTVVLDEFQWLKSAQPALDSIIQRHWDAWDRKGGADHGRALRQRPDDDGAPARTGRAAVRARDGQTAARAAGLPPGRGFRGHRRSRRPAAALGGSRRHAAIQPVGGRGTT